MEERRDHVWAVSIRVRHPADDVGALLSGWGLEVNRAWVAGQPRSTPRGGTLEGTWPDSYAYSKLAIREGSLASVLGLTLRQLDRMAHQIRQFVDEGGHAELSVGWSFKGNSGDVLGWELMERLSRCKLALSLDVYPEVEAEMEEMTDGQA